MSEPTLPATGPTPSFFSHVVGLVTAPSQEFKRIVPRGRFWTPLLGAIALNLAFTAVWVGHVDPRELTKNALEEMGILDRIPPDVLEQQLAAAGKGTFWRSSAIEVPALVAALGGFFLFIYRFMYGADLSFRQSVTIVSWALFIKRLITDPLILLTLWLKGDWNVIPEMALQANLAILFDRGSVPRFLFALAQSFDLFQLWLLFLLAAGFGVASKTSVGKAAWGVAIPWALLVLVFAGFAALMSSAVGR